MEESPGDANGGECLHHFEVTGGGRAGQSQSFKVNEKWDPAGDRREKKKQNNGCGHGGLSGWWPKGSAVEFSVNEKNERHAYESYSYPQTGGQAQRHSKHRAAPRHGGKSPE